MGAPVQPLALKAVRPGSSRPPLPSLSSLANSVHALSTGRGLGELRVGVCRSGSVPCCLWAEQGKGEIPLNAAQTEWAGSSSMRSQEPISWPTATIPGRTLLTDACDSFGKASVGRSSTSSRCLSKKLSALFHPALG